MVYVFYTRGIKREESRGAPPGSIITNGVVPQHYLPHQHRDRATGSGQKCTMKRVRKKSIPLVLEEMVLSPLAISPGNLCSSPFACARLWAMAISRGNGSCTCLLCERRATLAQRFPPIARLSLLSKAPNSPLIRWFYEGIPSGTHIPYPAWIPVVLTRGNLFALFTTLFIACAHFYAKSGRSVNA